MVDASVPTLRPSELERLAQLDEHNELSAERMRSTSQRLGVPEEDLRRWLADRRAASAPTRRIDVPGAASPRVDVPDAPTTRIDPPEAAPTQTDAAEAAPTQTDVPEAATTQTDAPEAATTRIGVPDPPTTRIDGFEPPTRQVGYGQVSHRPSRIITLSEAAGGALLPQISDGDVTTFLADAYRSLPAQEFARIDAVYTDGIQTTCRWLAEHTGRQCRHDLNQNGVGSWLGPRGAGLAEYMLSVLQPRLSSPNRFQPGPGAGVVDEWNDILSLYRFLGSLVADSPSRGHTITRLRGAQAAFLLHGLRLDLPSDLAYSVGPGLTTVPIDHDVIARVRARTADPVDAAALVTALFTGATAMELNAIPCVALTADALIFNGPIGYTHAPDLYVWVIPPPARTLLYDARVSQESRPTPNSKLFTGAIGGAGFRLRRLAAACEVSLPDLYHWHHSWIRRAGLLRMSEQPAPVRNTDLLFGLKLAPRPRRRRAR
ncbi:hypothetical protein [Nocardia gamkensis]|uniref:Uncharacterized protein n=1 Tax=Nocardia gamkensis TaxID=352869 RepID=A0A7X6L6F9_9NOCA|nr:hypothetical protein [Nocardia gamkensis]NKY28731.1 hypothetical protein [Nocardia gamkensis]NQE68014.1 hypothetical protein [Nocardia gamkensis]